jgi:hypothetical protein
VSGSAADLARLKKAYETNPYEAEQVPILWNSISGKKFSGQFFFHPKKLGNKYLPVIEQ